MKQDYVNGQVVVTHAFHPSIWEAEAADLCEFEASLVYRGSSRTGSKATQRNPVSNKKKKEYVIEHYLVIQFM